MLTLNPILNRKGKNGEVLIGGAVYRLHDGQEELLPETLKNLPGLVHGGRFGRRRSPQPPQRPWC